MNTINQIWNQSVEIGISLYKTMVSSDNSPDDVIKDDIIDSLGKMAANIPRYEYKVDAYQAIHNLSMALGKSYRIETMMLITNDLLPNTFTEKQFDMINDIQQLLYNERERIDPYESYFPPNYEMIRSEIFQS